MTTGSIFNNPHTGDNDKIHQHVKCLIDGAPSGAEVKLTTYHFAHSDITNALLDAVDRGVDVKILLDGAVPVVSNPDNPRDTVDYEEYQRVKDEIGSDHGADSWIRACPGSGGDSACIANRKMHDKLLTVSESHGVPNVTFLTSSNVQAPAVDQNSGSDMWNSGYTAANDPGIYGWFAGTYFEDMADPEPENLDYFEEQDLEPVGNYEIFHSPRKSGNTALDILDKVDCHDNDQVGTDPGNRTIVRVPMWSISSTGGIGTAIADRLWDLDNEGCYVDIVADEIGYDRANPSAYGALRTLLKKPQPTATGGGVNYHGPEVREFHEANLFGLHEKNLLIEGKYDGRKDQKIVFTGSYNFTQASAGATSAHAVNDETWLQINDAGVHDRFRDNFFDIRDAAHTCWQTSKAVGCDGGRSRGGDPGDELNCHETADAYGDTGYLYLYGDTSCKGANDAKDDSTADSDYGDGAGQIKDFDNRADSMVNSTTQHIEFYNYPNYNAGHPEGDSFCLRPGQWINRISKYSDNQDSWSDSISSHRMVDPGDCDRWFAGYHEPWR